MTLHSPYGDSTRRPLRRLIACLALSLLISTASALEPPLPELVKDINPLPGADSFIQTMLSRSGMLYFIPCKGDNPGDCDVWRSDGTANGTAPLSAWDSSQKALFGGGGLIDAGNYLYFTGGGGDFLLLYYSNLNAPSTRLLSSYHYDSNGNFFSSLLNPGNLTKFGNAVYFNAESNGSGEVSNGELWKVVDNTPSLIKRICDGCFDRYALPIAKAGRFLYFTASPSPNTLELWVIEEGNTESPPRLVRSFPDQSIAWKGMVAVGEILFLSVCSTGECELWRVDGTGEGTRRVATAAQLQFLYNHDGTLYFSSVNALWKTDGTSEGTVIVKSFLGSDARLTGLASVDETLFFTTETYTTPPINSLWRTDGFAEGGGGGGGEEHTAKIIDLPRNAEARDLLPVNGILYFSSNGLWRSDGTRGGTFHIPSPIEVSYLTLAGNNLFFVGYDDALGRELWKLPLRPAAVTLSNLDVEYNGSPLGAVCSTEPAGLATRITYRGKAEMPSAIGSYPVSCVVTDPGYSGERQDIFSIVPAVQKITGILPTGSLPFVAGTVITLSASGGASGNPVVFASTTPSICTVGGNSVTMLSAGTCKLSANQAGNANYQAAPQVIHSIEFTAGKIAQSISFSALNALSVGKSAPLAATTTSGLAVAFNSLTGSVCSVSGQTVAAIAAGVCQVAANQAGDAKYLAAPQVTQSFTVQPLPETTVPSAPTVGLIVPLKKQLALLVLPSANNGGAKITGYTATCSGNGQSTSATAPNAGILTVKHLKSGVKYACSARATNSKGDSPESVSMLATPR